MAISISVDRSGVFGDLRYVLATATYDDADTVIAVTPADFGLNQVYSVSSGITDGGQPVAYIVGELVPFDGPGTAGPLVALDATDVDGESVSLLVLGH